ncbi:type 11 methyltransferase [Strigomonas culicis]|uniref:Type 11 methyltransferase n=1 Tax=Strigomonas culicis TaxID=28005 RepID=S9WG82_9TRYP|nr:type 11 methyltransferase [Strigomonas culicis]|eukprot:EPY34745.1 type 11 methyltransferase [Strigomonas culicis]
MCFSISVLTLFIFSVFLHAALTKNFLNPLSLHFLHTKLLYLALFSFTLMPEPRHFRIDIRSREDYDELHPQDSYSFPWENIRNEACALPERSCSLDIIMKNDEKGPEVKAFFDRLGFLSVNYVTFASLPSEQLTRETTEGFCWSPNPYLKDKIQQVEQEIGVGTVLDVGCGSCRDMIFLSTRGWFVTGIDNREKLLQQGLALSQKYCVSEHILPLVSNIKQGLPLRNDAFDMIHICRFIDRLLMDVLCKKVKKNGLFLYSHFLEGCEKTEVGHPKNRNGFFENGELERILIKNNFTIVDCVYNELPDRRPMINISARRE